MVTVDFGSGSGTNMRECSKVIMPKLIFCDKAKAGLWSIKELAAVPIIYESGLRICGSLFHISI